MAHSRQRIAECDLPAHFWARVDCSGACWLWRGYVKPNGYGTVSIHRRDVHVHRYAYQLTYGEIPPGLFVLHRCDTPTCVRPEHLRLGTHADNMADMKQKRRQAFGDRCTWAKLTTLKAREMRARAGERQSVLAADFGVSTSTVSLVLLGKTWKEETR